MGNEDITIPGKSKTGSSVHFEIGSIAPLGLSIHKYILFIH